MLVSDIGGTRLAAGVPSSRAGGPADADVDDAAAEVARLIQKEMPFLRRIVRRWSRNPADIDDLVQDTVLRALANAHLWQPGTNFRAWVVTIMRNQFLAGLARSRRHAEFAAELAAACATGSGETPYFRLALRDLDGALARLPPRQRLVVLLVGVEGLSYDDAARTMGLSVAAVRCNLARARDRLRRTALSEETTSPLSDRPPRKPFRPGAKRRAAGSG